MLVGAECKVAARPGGDQHEKRRFGKVKVSEQPTDHPKLESRINENVSFPSSGLNFSVVFAPHMFECPEACGAHGNDAPALLEGRVQGEAADSEISKRSPSIL